MQAIAWSGRADADDVLRDLLADAIATCRTLAGRAQDPAPALDAATWPRVCATAPVS